MFKSMKSVFKKNRIEFGEAFSEFSKSLTLIIDIEQLKDNVIAKIREIIHVDPILIFLHNPDMNRYDVEEVRGLAVDGASGMYFFPEEPLIRWFTINESSLLIPENPAVFSFFNERERDILTRSHATLLFPLMVMNRVTGLVSMGPKTDGEQFSDPEIDLLNTFLGQAAFAFENAYLYQQQKTRLKKMYRADRLATLGQLAAGAAHEIRNPLTSIRSTIQYLEKDLKDTAKRGLIVDLIGEVDRINDIIEGLLSFSKPGKPQRETVNLRNLLEQTLNLVATTVRKRRIDLTFEYSSEETTFMADPAQLKQVFLNIIMNALQSMEDGGRFKITVALKRHEGFPGQNKTAFLIAFTDNGVGIPNEDLDHIFDPFFTTKKDGTGLGLSITYGIVHQHGGDIEIESRTAEDSPKDHGTTVTLQLPIH